MKKRQIITVERYFQFYLLLKYDYIFFQIIYSFTVLSSVNG